MIEHTLRSSVAIHRDHLNNIDIARVLGGYGSNMHVARACLEMLGCSGEGSALELAAIASKGFVAAHNRLGQNRPATR